MIRTRQADAPTAERRRMGSQKTHQANRLPLIIFKRKNCSFLIIWKITDIHLRKFHWIVLRLISGAIQAVLNIEKGPLYKIDSIHIIGNAKISVDFMERYLGIPEGSIYRKDRLLLISKRILELPFVQEERPWSVSMLGTGSILNLYLKPKRSSQIDVLVGLLPNNDQLQSGKLLVTGEATVVLRNPFGNGESLGLDWQQLQQKSPRLNVNYPAALYFSFPLRSKPGFFTIQERFFLYQYRWIAGYTV